MPRRFHVPHIFAGAVALSPEQAHHASGVLRLQDGVEVELFDDGGRVARGPLRVESDTKIFVDIEADAILDAASGGRSITIAAAIPRGDRADWMVEKLSELGVVEWTPLLTSRAVVKTVSENKHERWRRIATESAKQCRRAGVLRIAEMIDISSALRKGSDSPAKPIVLSTDFTGDSSPLGELCVGNDAIRLFIGPEGDWTNEELRAFADAKIPPARLGESILRVETAAIVAAAVAMLA